MNVKELNAPISTITYNRDDIESKVGNIYEAIVIMGKRSDQINMELKNELIQKLDEFASHNDSLEETFENKEQIEVSKYYEKLPKSNSIAIDEWLKGDVYYRVVDQE